MLILESPDPSLTTFYRETKCESESESEIGKNEECENRMASSLGQRVQLGKIIIDWQEKHKQKVLNVA